MKLRDIDTKKLMFDIKNVKNDDNIFKVFPELNEYSELKWSKVEGPDNNIAMKTILLL